MYSSGVQAHRVRVVGLACAAKRQNAVQAQETAVHDVGMLSQLEHRHVLKHYDAFIEKVRGRRQVPLVSLLHAQTTVTT